MTHLPGDSEGVARLREPTTRHPWRVLVSACMTGQRVAWDGGDNGMSGQTRLQEFLNSPRVEVVPMCPEHLAMGTPRGMPDIHGGDGLDVLAGTARVLVDGQTDVTQALLVHAQAMAERGEQCDLAVLVDMSATCGSQGISLGSRAADPRRYQAAPGLVASLLWRKHIPFTSIRDFKTLEALRHRVGLSSEPGKLDHHEIDWCRENFPEAPWSRSERALAQRPPVSERQPVCKVLTAAQWQSRRDTVPWAPVDRQDGFLHLSTETQLAETLRLHFAGQTNLVVLHLDAARIPELVWEPSRGGERFPHAYGDTPLDCVVEVKPL